MVVPSTAFTIRACAGFVIGAAFAAALAACGTSAGARGERPSMGETQRGWASFYSSSLAGHKTASGERYQPAAFTAAHRALPLGARVRVTRLDNDGHPTGRSVVVRINDRGPFGRAIIDLSLAAARALDMVRAGVVPVEIELLEPERS